MNITISWAVKSQNTAKFCPCVKILNKPYRVIINCARLPCLPVTAQFKHLMYLEAYFFKINTGSLYSLWSSSVLFPKTIPAKPISLKGSVRWKGWNQHQQGPYPLPEKGGTIHCMLSMCRVWKCQKKKKTWEAKKVLDVHKWRQETQPLKDLVMDEVCGKPRPEPKSSSH